MSEQASMVKNENIPEWAKAYSPECVEGGFSEVGFRPNGVLRSSPHTSNSKQHQIYAK